jgi:hypothetical protein
MRRSLLRPLLAREYIGESLRQYFEKDVIATAAKSRKNLAFNRMLGEGEYRREVAALYAKKPDAWLTPVETFAPYYSHALARWILASHHRRGEDGTRPLHIVEVGGGTGVNAATILRWFQSNHPTIYATLRYTLLDVSEAQGVLQRRATKLHDDKVTVMISPDGRWSRALTDSASWPLPCKKKKHAVATATSSSSSSRRKRNARIQQRHARQQQSSSKLVNDDDDGGDGDDQSNTQPTPSPNNIEGFVVEPDVHILALELLDNLPHDRVVSMAGSCAQLYEAHVVRPPSSSSSPNRDTPSRLDATAALDASAGGTAGAADNTNTTTNNNIVTSVIHDGPWREELRPLSDPLLRKALELCPDVWVKPLLAAAASSPAQNGGDGGGGGGGGVGAAVGAAVAALFSQLQQHLLAVSGTEASTAAAAASSSPSERNVDRGGGFTAAFVPTGCLSLLQELHACFPRHALLLADFDTLPPPDLDYLTHSYSASSSSSSSSFSSFSTVSTWPLASLLFSPTTATAPSSSISPSQTNHRRQPMGEGSSRSSSSSASSREATVDNDNDEGGGGVEVWTAETLSRSPRVEWGAPLVSSRCSKTGENCDHPTYLVPFGSSDILFPTDFTSLERLYRGSAAASSSSSSSSSTVVAVSAKTVKSHTFLKTYADVAATATRSGYNPILEDFTNTSVFIGEVGDANRCPPLK